MNICQSYVWSSSNNTIKYWLCLIIWKWITSAKFRRLLFFYFVSRVHQVDNLESQNESHNPTRAVRLRWSPAKSLAKVSTTPNKANSETQIAIRKYQLIISLIKKIIIDEFFGLKQSGVFSRHFKTLLSKQEKDNLISENPTSARFLCVVNCLNKLLSKESSIWPSTPYPNFFSQKYN